MEQTFDVIVIGAGAAGLFGAWEIALTGRKVAIIEAQDRVGGRIHTVHEKEFEQPVELGAEFVHGKLKLTQMLSERSDAKYQKVNGEIWQKTEEGFDDQKDFIEDFSDLEKKFKEVKEDLSVSDFIKQYLKGEKYDKLRFTLKNYVEGYDAADTTRASTVALKEDLMSSSDEQYRIDEGYGKLIEYLAEQCTRNGVEFHLFEKAEKIKWQKDNVEVDTGQNKYFATKILITVSLGVLQSGKIKFSPGIPEKMEAARKLGYGSVIKIILQFDEPFWKNKKLTKKKNLNKLGFLFTKEKIPAWWTQYPRESFILTGWLGGPHADDFKECSDDDVLQTAFQSLKNIFTIDAEKKLLAYHVCNWATDPHSCGAYAYDVVNGTQFRNVLIEPIENTIFFAGEALADSAEIGTVEAAFVSGRNTAHKLTASFV